MQNRVRDVGPRVPVRPKHSSCFGDPQSNHTDCKGATPQAVPSIPLAKTNSSVNGVNSITEDALCPF